MPKEKFFQNLRTAVATLLPRIDPDHPYTEPDELEPVLRTRTTWLTPESVAGFDPEDFQDLNPEVSADLERNVGMFLQIVTKINTKNPATKAQVDSAIPPFLAIISAVRKIVLDEWLLSARAVIDQAILWARAEDWPTKLYPWKLTEKFLGTYELDRLVFGIAGSQMALMPVGRFATHHGGAFDLAVMPAFDSVSVTIGSNQKWKISPLPGEKTSHRWKEDLFVEVCNKLARMG